MNCTLYRPASPNITRNFEYKIPDLMESTKISKESRTIVEESTQITSVFHKEK